jgi:DNA-binding LacI/PurR family transcriptional regulator
MSPTSHDVARLAGVDRSTVSLVLNDPQTRRVGSETKRRVLAAVSELGYSPNGAARQLRSGSSRVLLMPFWSLPFGPNFDGWIEGMGEACERHGLIMLVHGSRTARGAAGARVWASMRPDIFVTDAGRLDAESVAILRNSGTRAVLTLGASDLEDVRPLVFDLGVPGRLAARRLIEIGVSELVALAPTDPQLVGLARVRAEGFLEAAGDAGFDPQVLWVSPDGTELKEWVASLPATGGSTGVFAYNDQYAMQLLEAARDAGVDVPGRLAVIGVDNLPSGATSVPPLTTLSYRPPEFGASVVEAAIAIADGATDVQLPQFDFRMTVRESA